MRIRKHAQKISTASTTASSFINNTTSATSSIIPSPSPSPPPPLQPAAAAAAAACERANNLQTHVCELNRSPWDVISFTSELYYPDDYQALMRDDIITGDTIEQGSVNAFNSSKHEPIISEEEEDEVEEEDEDDDERRYSMLVDVDELKREKIGKNKRENKKKNNNKKMKEDEKEACSKTDGKGWNCRRKAKEGHTLCEHHLTQLRSYTTTNNQPNRKSDNIKAINSICTSSNVSSSGRRRNKGKVSASSKPGDYYYYSGFGPLWGKKRRGSSDVVKNEEREIQEPVVYQNQNPTRIRNAPSTIISHMDVDVDVDDDVMYDDDDDDDEYYDHHVDNGVDVKRRIRKPIKARSLKSLL